MQAFPCQPNSCKLRGNTSLAKKSSCVGGISLPFSGDSHHIVKTMDCYSDAFVKRGKPKSYSLDAKFQLVRVCKLADCGILYKGKGVEKPSWSQH